MKKQITEAILRHVLGWAGVVGTLDIQNDLGQLAALVAAVGTLAWSIWAKIQASKKS
jgi:hypothetical protein